MSHAYTALPLGAAALLGAALLLPASLPLLLVCGLALIGAVQAAVHHAEVVAHKVGEPFGTLVLALAVTVIEVALIVSMMLAGGPDKAALPRDTLYAAVMVIVTGVIGLCLLAGGLRHREQEFHGGGVNSGLAALVALVGLSLVLPNFTTSSAVGTYTDAQLGFAAICSLVLWLVFVFVQTISHRDYFLPPGPAAQNEELHAPPPSSRRAWGSFALLLVALVAVVGLAKQLSPAIEAGLRGAGAPPAALGIAIAMLVLMPETIAAVRAARADRLQTSMNLALGSALASIGLTIPAVIALALWLDLPLLLGLAAKEMVLLALSLLVSAITLASGRTTLMQGAIHLVLFGAFLFLALVP